MQTKKSERQAKVLIEFQRTVSRTPAHLRWTHAWMREPPIHKWWRVCASVVYHIKLWRRAGLPMDTALKKMLRRHQVLARKAHVSWLKYARFMNLPNEDFTQHQ